MKLFIILILVSSCQDDWRRTYAPDSDEPYGSELIYNNLKDLFPDQVVTSERLSIYNNELHANISSIDFQDFNIENPLFDTSYTPIKEVETPQENWILIEPIAFTAEDVFGIFNHCVEGNHVLISSENFDYHLTAALAIIGQDSIIKDSTVTLTAQQSRYPFDQVYKLYSHQSERLNDKLITFENRTIASKISIGTGTLTICSAPTLFTNYNLIKENNHELIELLFKVFSQQKIRWHQRYDFKEFGRKHTTASAPSYLDYIYKNPELAAAYFILILGALLYALFGIKRMQRLIPEVNRTENATVKFITQIAQLYQDKGSHIDLAHKKLLFFNEWLKNHYRIKSSSHILETFQQVENKNPNMIKLIAELREQTKKVEQQTAISKQQLFKLNTLIENIKATA